MNKWRLSVALTTVFLCFIGAFAPIFAQDLTVSGSVLDDRGKAIAGVSIKAKGVQAGGFSDKKGLWRVSIPNSKAATLVFSYIGFKPFELKVTESKSDIAIRMEEDVLKTAEIVVTGLATGIARTSLPNAIASVSASELLAAPASTMDQALAGKFAGVNISQNTGAPGGGISVTLRGISSIIGRSQPLYVVDGLIVNNDAVQSGIDGITKSTGVGSNRPQGQPSNRIADLNPNDIEDIQVLKGASAAALYGAKASNGVIIVTTKKGRANTTEIDFTQQIGASSVLKTIGSRVFTSEAEAKDFAGDLGVTLWRKNNGQFFDLEKELYGNTGLITESSLSVRGGSDKTQFFVGGLAHNETGIIKGTGYSKYSLRSNINQEISENVRFEAGINVIRSESDRGVTGNDNTGLTLGVALSQTPSFVDLRPVNGVYPANTINGNTSNPIETRDKFKNNETIYRFIASSKLFWDIFKIEGQSLTFVAQGGADYFTQRNKVISPANTQFEQGQSQPGQAINAESGNVNSNLYLNLLHVLETENQLSFKTTLGYQFENIYRNETVITTRNVIPGQDNLNRGASLEGYQFITKQIDKGFFFQEEVDIKNLLFLTAGVRGDASSINGDGNQYYLFPKGAVSLRLSQLDFWKDISGTINEFKLRAAYGQTGNYAVPTARFASLTTLNIDGGVGLINQTLKGNPLLRPERTGELEFGFDSYWLEGRLRLNASYYTQTVTDLVLQRQLPPSSGYVNQYDNVGTMKKQGFEVELGLNPVRTESVNWNFNVNFHKYDAVLTELKVPAFYTGGFSLAYGQYRIEQGVSPLAMYGLDKDASGKRIQIGSEIPNFQIGVNSSLTIARSFNFRFNVDWKNGGSVINLAKLLYDANGLSPDYQASIDRLSLLSKGTNTKFVDDGSYVKLREVALDYTFDRAALSGFLGGIFRSLRLGVSGRNLIMLTPYWGYDPEVSNFGNLSVGRSVDVLGFPSARSYYFTLAFGL